VKLTTHFHLVPRSKNVWSYISTLTIRLHGVVHSYNTGTTLLYLYLFNIIKEGPDMSSLRA